MINKPSIKRPLGPVKVVAVSLTLGIVLLVTVFLALTIGAADVTYGQFFSLFFGENQPEIETVRMIVLKIRLPRILLAGLAGFSLSLGGVVFQALLRNPLADPFILGVSSGGALGAVVAIILGLGFRFGIPVMAFGGSLLTVYLVMMVGRRKMGMESSTILLTGVIINAFFTAIIMFFISSAVDDRLHSMLFWLYGDLSQSYYSQSAIIAPAAFGAFGLLYTLARHLNIITSGEETALQLGVDVEKTKKVCFLAVSLTIGLVVSFSGLIGFVGLVVPHLARMTLGSDHRLLMPVSALGGAIFLIAADTLARTIISPNELPVGVITAFIGAPFFIYLLKTRGSKWSRS
jgi:iron complex transport system permease protein